MNARTRQASTPSDTRGSAPADTLRASEFELGGERFLVISVPLDESRPAGLTIAEYEVARAAARGEANRAIATSRGTSVTTTANQLASAYAKLGVRNRRELTAALATRRHRGGSASPEEAAPGAPRRRR